MPAADSLALFARKVRQARKLKHWSQAKLADQTGISEETISNIERQSASTKLATAAKLAEALGIELWELLLPDTASEGASAPIERREALTELQSLLDQLDAEQVRALTSMAKGVLGLRKD
jgi:transcriptional regulator with XRE-family HTH domain